MSKKGKPIIEIAPPIVIDIDLSEPSATPPRKKRAQHMLWPDEIEQRWRRIAITVGAVALVVGIMIGRFLLP